MYGCYKTNDLKKNEILKATQESLITTWFVGVAERCTRNSEVGVGYRAAKQTRKLTFKPWIFSCLAVGNGRSRGADQSSGNKIIVLIVNKSQDVAAEIRDKEKT